MKTKPKIYALRPNFRFWQFINDGWVRLTMKPGQSIYHRKAYDSGEGWSSEDEQWSLNDDATFVDYQCDSRGTDCDGRHSSSWIGFFDINRGSYLPVFIEDWEWNKPVKCRPERFRFMRPEFEKRKSWQRDYSAEAAGY